MGESHYCRTFKLWNYTTCNMFSDQMIPQSHSARIILRPPQNCTVSRLTLWFFRSALRQCCCCFHCTALPSFLLPAFASEKMQSCANSELLPAIKQKASRKLWRIKSKQSVHYYSRFTARLNKKLLSTIYIDVLRGIISIWCQKAEMRGELKESGIPGQVHNRSHFSV